MHLAISHDLIMIIIMIVVATVSLLEGIRARVVRIVCSLSIFCRSCKNSAVWFTISIQFFILRIISSATYGLTYAMCHGSGIDDSRLHVSIQLLHKIKVFFYIYACQVKQDIFYDYTYIRLYINTFCLRIWSHDCYFTIADRQYIKIRRRMIYDIWILCKIKDYVLYNLLIK